MIIDFKLLPEKPIANAIPSSSSSFYLGALILLLTIISSFLLTALLFLVTPTHWLLLLPPDNSLLPTELIFALPDRPRWTRERLVRRLPQCLIIGVRKSGTRALIEFLNLHPRIRKASDEIHYFDEEQNYVKGLAWYRRQMPFSYADQITVEKSPAYFITRYVPERVSALNSSIKLILVVKNPVSRIISDYTQTRLNRIKKGKRFLSFEDTVLTADGRVDVGYKPIRVSMYHRHLSNWLKVFPMDQIQIVDGDTLISHPVDELSRVETFLGLDHRINQQHFHFNQTKGFFCIRDPEDPRTDRCLSKTKGRPHPDVSEEVLKKLSEFFRPHNQLFYAMVGRDFGW